MYRLTRPLTRLPQHPPCNMTTRSLWIGQTSTGPSLSSCMDQSLGNVIQKLEGKTPSVCIALLSKSFQQHQYKQAMAQLEKTWKEADVPVLGCIVDRVPTFGHGVSLLVGVDEAVAPFYVPDDPTAAKVRTISVGRWGQVQDFDRFKYQGNALKEQGWAAFDSISQPPKQRQTDQEQTAASIIGSLPPNANFVWLMTDREPDHTLQVLDDHFSFTTKFGLAASSTPFVTGTPHWLYYQGQIHPAGTLGFASYNKPKPWTSLRLTHPSLAPIGRPVPITRVRGNVILELDGGGATNMLMDLIHQNKVANKDEPFYLAFQPIGANDVVVARITSGDPARGNMAVETTLDLLAGQQVRFLKSKDIPLSPQSLLDSDDQEIMVFGTVDLDHTIDVHPPSEQPASVKPIFGATSESAVLLGHAGQPTLFHQVPFASLRLRSSIPMCVQ